MIKETLTLALTSILHSMEDLFEASGHGNLCLVTIMPGEEVPFDYCSRCDDGMAWVRLVSMQQPETDRDQFATMNCYTSLAATIEVGSIFAAPWPEADGDLPEPEEHLTASLRQLECADLLLQALICTDINGDHVTSPTYAPFGPSGGCVGGAWSGMLTLT